MANPPQPQPEDEEEELIGVSEMPEELKSDGSPENLAKIAEVRAQMQDPSTELGAFFAGMEPTPPTSKD